MGGGQLRHVAPGEAGEHQQAGPLRQGGQLAQHLQPVHAGEHQIQHHHVGVQLPGQTDGLLAVAGLRGHLHGAVRRQSLHDQAAELLAGVCHQNPRFAIQC